MGRYLSGKIQSSWQQILIVWMVSSTDTIHIGSQLDITSLNKLAEFTSEGKSCSSVLTLLHEQTRIAIGVHLQYGVKEITLTGQRVYFLTKT